MLPDAATALLPLFHPTTVVHVEDSTRYADLLGAVLEPEMIVSHCTSAAEAFVHLDPARSSASMSADLLTTLSRRPCRTAADVLAIREVMFDERRFNDVAVAIIDYAMPDMDGLELCRKLDGGRIGRIMLTARADRETGARAIEDGLIDYFIEKSSPTFLAELRAAVAALQIRYFNRSDAWLDTQALAHLAFVHEPTVVAALRRYLTIVPVEMYLCDCPAGVLYIDAIGMSEFVLVFSEAEYQSRVADAMHAGAPDAYVRQLTARTWLSWHGQRAGFFDAVQPVEADDLLRTTVLCGERGNYLVATLGDAQMWKDDTYVAYASWLGGRDDRQAPPR